MGNSLISGASLLLEGDIENIRPLNAGYRILGIHPNTAASRAGLVSFFDFIVGCNDKLLFPPKVSEGSVLFQDDGSQLSSQTEEEGPIDLVDEIRKAILANDEINLLVFNIKSRESRYVLVSFKMVDYVTSPSSLSSSSSVGSGGMKSETRLGAMIILDSYRSEAEERIIQVFDVKKGSPADKAGLLPQRDYILGTKDVAFHSVRAFSSMLKRNEDKAIDLFVYDAKSDFVRVVQLTPTFSWGGGFRMRNSMLGAAVVSQLLNYLPVQCLDTNGNSVYAVLRQSSEDYSCKRKDEGLHVKEFEGKHRTFF